MYVGSIDMPIYFLFAPRPQFYNQIRLVDGLGSRSFYLIYLYTSTGSRSSDSFAQSIR